MEQTWSIDSTILGGKYYMDSTILGTINRPILATSGLMIYGVS